MKFIIAVSALLACAASSPTAYIVPLAEISAPIASQYHSQDSLGQYTYGYANHLSAKSEARAFDGSVLGSYSYLDPSGKIQSVEYAADDQGFRATSSNLPVAPAVPEVPVVAVPVPIQDTPEVVEARAKHLAAVEEAKSRAGQDEIQAEDRNSVEIPAIKSDVALKSEGQNLAITSSVPLSPIPLLAYGSAVYATPGVAIKSFVSPTLALRAAPSSAFSYSYGINNIYGYNSLYYPGFSTYSAPITQVVTSPVIARNLLEHPHFRKIEGNIVKIDSNVEKSDQMKLENVEKQEKMVDASSEASQAKISNSEQ
ncbi:cuticle protein-like [Diabrotica virgifera virgifera]|uniref:Cuticle protein-like n=1 Tax=Diabrotica virgifera virgifera TaxID=50390 RepID=A0A6P7FNG2_DIAVI|nr:cuticle protein-like [Diabrotica virgifera virgifera]